MEIKLQAFQAFELMGMNGQLHALADLGKPPQYLFHGLVGLKDSVDIIANILYTHTITKIHNFHLHVYPSTVLSDFSNYPLLLTNVGGVTNSDVTKDAVSAVRYIMNMYIYFFKIHTIMNKNKVKLFTYLLKINPELGNKAYVKFIWAGGREARNKEMCYQFLP